MWTKITFLIKKAMTKKVQTRVSKKFVSHISPERLKQLLKNNPVVKVCHSREELKDYFDKLAGLK